MVNETQADSDHYRELKKAFCAKVVCETRFKETIQSHKIRFVLGSSETLTK